MRDSPIEELPPDLDITGELDSSGSRVTKLNGNPRIFGSLILSHSRIRTLPEHLFVEGNLVLKNSLITELPEYLTVYDEIDLAESKLVKLGSVGSCNYRENIEKGCFSSKLLTLPMRIKNGNTPHLEETI